MVVRDNRRDIFYYLCDKLILLIYEWNYLFGDRVGAYG